jgi:CheY-like chemotaxis protein
MMVDKCDVKTWQALAVDDDLDSLDVIRLTLSFHGADVITANGGEQALELLKTLQPTIVFLDLSMPGIDGWSLLHHIKNELELEETPVVALTAHAMKGDRERVLEAGFDYYMTKPFSPLTFMDDLLAMISANGHSGVFSPNQIQVP